jgi:uncharacterized membrane protein
MPRSPAPARGRTRPGSTPARPPAPRWLVLASLVLCGLGLIDAAYLTYEHYTASTTLACSNTGTINCLKVTTSSYSKVAGVPVALLGLLFFVGMTVLCLPAVWRSADARIRRLRLAGVAVGMLSVLYLVWVELFKVDAICEWCTGVHVLTFVLFALVVVESTGTLTAE